MKAAILNASTLGTDKYTARLAAALARLVSVAGLPLSELPLSDCAASVTEIRRLSAIIGGKQQRPDVQANELLEQYSLMKQVLQTQAEAQFASLSELDWSDEHRAFTERFVRDLCGLVEAFGTGCTQRAVAAFSEGHCEQIGMVVNEAPSPERDQHPSASLQKLASMPCITGIEANMSTFQQKVRTWKKLYATPIPDKWEVWRALALLFCKTRHEQITTELHAAFEQHKDSVDVSKILNGLMKCTDFEKELENAYPAQRQVSVQALDLHQATIRATPGSAAEATELRNQTHVEPLNPFASEISSGMPMMQPTMPTMHSTTTSSPPLGPADHATAVPAAEMATDELHLEQQTAQPEEPLPEVFLGAITKAFVPYLPLYAEAEANTLKLLVKNSTESENRCHSTDEVRVLEGGCELFRAIRSSLKRCSRISQSMLVEELYRSAYRPALTAYSRFLRDEAAKTVHSVRTLCHIVNSGKTFMDTAADLESSLQKMSGAAGSRALGSWDVFLEAQNIAVQTVVSSIMQDISPILLRVGENTSSRPRPRRKSKESQSTAQLGTQGSGFAGGCSMYVDDMADMLKQHTHTMAEHLLEENFDLVAAELVDKFTAAYCDQLLQCTSLNGEDIRQLLNDSSTILTILMGMEYPENLRASGDPAAIQMAMHAMQRIVGILETLTANKAVLATRYTELVTNGTSAELKKMLSTLGTLDRREVEAILREYVSSADGDESSAVPFAPGGKSSPPASSMTGLNIRSRLRGFKDKIKSHAGNDGANTQGDLIGAGAEQREGGYLDRLKNIRK